MACHCQQCGRVCECGDELCALCEGGVVCTVAYRPPDNEPKE